MGSSGEEGWRRELAELPARPGTERAAFLMELGWSRAGRPTPGLRTFLDDPEALVRVAAAQAVWQTAGNPRELGRLVAVLVDGLGSDDEDLALTAGTALVQMGQAAVAPLVRLFDKRGEKDARIVRVVSEIAGAEAERFLERAARSPRPEAAEEAREGLRAIAEED